MTLAFHLVRDYEPSSFCWIVLYTMSSNNNPQNDVPGRASKSSSIQSRSTLANLLSSQRRSAAQSRRHLVQRALPFANLHKDGSTGNAAIQSFSAKGGPACPSSQAHRPVRNQLKGVDELAKSPANKGDDATNGAPQMKKCAENIKQKSTTESTDPSPPRELENYAKLDKHARKRVSFGDVGDINPLVKLDSFPASTKTIHGIMKQKSASEELIPETMISSDEMETKNTECTCDSIASAEIDIVHNSLKRKRAELDNTKPISLGSNPKCDTTANSLVDVNGKNGKNASANNPSKKKKKEFSPFRVKVGCVVAVRFRKLADGGNSNIRFVKKVGDTFCPIPEENTESQSTAEPSTTKDENFATSTTNKDTTDPSNQPHRVPTKTKKVKSRKPGVFEVWTSPRPGQDSGLSLLGRRVRCFFPKSFLEKWKKSNENVDDGSIKRIVEGNVVSILDNDRGFGMTVGLLINRSLLKYRPYLQTTYDSIDDPVPSPSEQKRRNVEALIRGKDKVVVRVNLSTVYESRIGSIDKGSVAQWVVAAHVPAKPVGVKPSKTERKEGGYTSQSLFVGDENDTRSRQEENWRWSASRSAHLHSCGVTTGRSGIISGSQLFGEVVDMTVGPVSQDCSSSLATVTIRRLLAPHQTRGGRMPHHGELELFDIENDSGFSFFQVPVEQVIVIGRRVSRHSDSKELQSALDYCYTISYSYNSREDIYTPIFPPIYDDDTGCDGEKLPINMCHNCRRLSPSSQKRKCHGKSCTNAWCAMCLQSIGASTSCEDEDWIGPCCSGKCSCISCCRLVNECSRKGCCLICNKLCMHKSFVKCSSCNARFHDECAQWQLNIGVSDSAEFICQSCRFRESSPQMPQNSNPFNSVFAGLIASMASANPLDFSLPDDAALLSVKPSFVPYSGDRKCNTHRHKSLVGAKKQKKSAKKTKQTSSNGGTCEAHHVAHSATSDDYDQFKPTCCRAIPFEEFRKTEGYLSCVKSALSEDNEPLGLRENARPRKIVVRKVEEKNSVSDRAARVSQRRMLRSLSSLGDAAKTIDRLAGRDREEQLRFGRSRIHGWGVFATEPINAGDMIIEYRGELIGNAVADKRELEYEKAKICDYMFRIDEHTVCDATKLGNVARYINASCSPNCYTQIITANINKRIVIYAKKNIKRGEELCYDYKFPIEYNEAKRIPCNCKSSDCRGFMNWDKKYVLIDNPYID
ncbi:hypothetical protein HJC23_012764 [Cyclotella cryptica]|uniref:[histone H3]-lysine(4) N-trimethyltransferase n=1 Tax=Cyclotella cryptica TaxID=29204 RepID=A0ABD3Q2Q9_9STRA|eukprot:CCRYP_008974-RA/>CCRYP_008974-RA protein AED:0.02 eAED:0.02 QI:253/1/1/1/0.75/0.6/5/1160/1203